MPDPDALDSLLAEVSPRLAPDDLEDLARRMATSRAALAGPPAVCEQVLASVRARVAERGGREVRGAQAISSQLTERDWVVLTTHDLLSFSPEQQLALLDLLQEGPVFAVTRIADGDGRAKTAAHDGALRMDLYYRLTGAEIDLSTVGWDDGSTWPGKSGEDPTLEAVRQAVIGDPASFVVVGGSRWQRRDLQGVLTSPYRPGSAATENSRLFLAVEALLGVPVAEQRASFERLPASVQRVITAPSLDFLERAGPFLYPPLVAADRVFDLRTVPPVPPRFA